MKNMKVIWVSFGKQKGHNPTGILRRGFTKTKWFGQLLTLGHSVGFVFSVQVGDANI
jgi:hypothetical protein